MLQALADFITGADIERRKAKEPESLADILKLIRADMYGKRSTDDLTLLKESSHSNN